MLKRTALTMTPRRGSRRGSSGRARARHRRLSPMRPRRAGARDRPWSAPRVDAATPGYLGLQRGDRGPEQRHPRLPRDPARSDEAGDEGEAPRGAGARSRHGGSVTSTSSLVGLLARRGGHRPRRLGPRARPRRRGRRARGRARPDRAPVRRRRRADPRAAADEQPAVQVTRAGEQGGIHRDATHRCRLARIQQRSSIARTAQFLGCDTGAMYRWPSCGFSVMLARIGRAARCDGRVRCAALAVGRGAGRVSRRTAPACCSLCATFSRGCRNAVTWRA